MVIKVHSGKVMLSKEKKEEIVIFKDQKPPFLTYKLIFLKTEKNAFNFRTSIRQ